MWLMSPTDSTATASTAYEPLLTERVLILDSVLDLRNQAWRLG